MYCTYFHCLKTHPEYLLKTRTYQLQSRKKLPGNIDKLPATYKDSISQVKGWGGCNLVFNMPHVWYKVQWLKNLFARNLMPYLLHSHKILVAFLSQ